MYEKLVVFRSVWAERKVILDEVDPKIRRNFERQGWLPLLDVEHPPPAALIREFYSNLSIHFDCSNIHYVKTWIQGEEFVITLEVVASALVYLWYSSLCILTQRFLLSMTSCLFILVLPLVGVLILELPHMSLSSSITCSLGFLVTTFDLFLIYIPFPLRDVHSCTLSSLMLLSVFLLFLFVLLLRLDRKSVV